LKITEKCSTIKEKYSIAMGGKKYLKGKEQNIKNKKQLGRLKGGGRGQD